MASWLGQFGGYRPPAVAPGQDESALLAAHFGNPAYGLTPAQQQQAIIDAQGQGTPGTMQPPPSGAGSSSGSSSATSPTQSLTDRLNADALAAQQQAASQSIADQYTDAGYAAELAGGQDFTGGPTPTTQPTSMDRLADTQWAGYAGKHTPAQASQLEGMAGAGPDVPWVTVPVDKVVTAGTSAQIRPLAAAGTRGHVDPGGSVPMVHRSAALPTPPATTVHPTQGGAA